MIRILLKCFKKIQKKKKRNTPATRKGHPNDFTKALIKDGLNQKIMKTLRKKERKKDTCLFQALNSSVPQNFQKEKRQYQKDVMPINLLALMSFWILKSSKDLSTQMSISKRNWHALRDTLSKINNK